MPPAIAAGVLLDRRKSTLAKAGTTLVAYASSMHLIDGAGAWTRAAATISDWAEQLRTPDLSVGTYCIPAGGRDTQSPHTEDEIYVVTAGRARIVTPDGSADVEPGSVIFVPAGEEHRFDERLAGPEARQRALAWRRQAATRWRSHAAGQH